jgi:hypothetical protein
MAPRNLPPGNGAAAEADEFNVAALDRRVASDAHYDEEIRGADRGAAAGSSGSWAGICMSSGMTAVNGG